MDAEQTLNYMEKIITGNPHCHAQGWKREIDRRAANVRAEICNLRRFTNKPSSVLEVCMAHAQFLEDRLNDLLTIYQNQEG